MTGVVKHCATCHYQSYKAPAAPMIGHTTATATAQALALDVIHLSDQKWIQIRTDDDGCMVPLKKIDSREIEQALRHWTFPIGLGKPGLFLLDDGPEFKGKLQEVIQAWEAEARVHAPHHHESAGVIEIFNRTIEKKIFVLKHGTQLTWYDVYMDAVDAYSPSPRL